MRTFSSLTHLVLMLASLASVACHQQVSAGARPDAGEAAVGTLVSAGAMATPRAAHTATPLRDGRVLLAGGIGGEHDATFSAEVYDPASARFSPTGPMRTPRHSHTATRLADGKILLAGGYGAGDDYLSSAEIFDPASSDFAPTGRMRNARAGHVAVRLPDNRVLLVGGVGTGWTFLASSEIYDPATGTFSPTGSMAMPRESHVAVLLADGQVLVIGGHRGRREQTELFKSIERYDPTTGTFSAAGEMAVRRHKHDAVTLPDGRVLVTGGADERDDKGRYNSAEMFDPRTGRSLPIAPMQRARYKHAGSSVVLPDGRVFIGGGAPEAEVYDPASRRFVLVAGGARMAGQFSAAAGLPEGRVLVTGGYGGSREPQAGAWLYKP